MRLFRKFASGCFSNLVFDSLEFEFVDQRLDLAPDTFVIKLNEVPVIFANVNLGQFFVNDIATNIRMLQMPAQDVNEPNDSSSRKLGA